MEHFLNLRRRHQTFVAEYVKCGIASKALVETGYRGPDAKKRAYDILKRPKGEKPKRSHKKKSTNTTITPGAAPESVDSASGSTH